MRSNPSAWLFATSLLVLVAAGCAKHDTQTAQSAGSDSLIASNPLEAPSGSLKPQVPYEPAPAAAPEPTPAPRHAARPPEEHVRRHHERAHATPTPSEPRESSEAPAPEAAAPGPASAPGLNVEWGSYLHVTIADALSSETAKVGDAWSGTLKDPVYVRDQVALPAGSTVHGTVTDAKPAEKGDRASLTLEVTSVEANGQSWPILAKADPIVAGSTRARNIGGIAGGTAAGALIGSAVGGGKGSLIGGLLGGVASGAAVARSKGYQAVVKSGTTMSFTVASDVVVRP